MSDPLTGRELQNLYMLDPTTRPQVLIDAQQYMATYGRYALGAAARQNVDFRQAWTIKPLGQDFSISSGVNNYKRDINGSDWFDRALGYGNAGFTIEGRFELVNGEKRFIGTITPQEDNYDFGPSPKGIFATAASVVNQLLDPFGTGNKLVMNYSGTGQAIDINLADFDVLALADQQAVQDYNDMTTSSARTIDAGIADEIGDGVMLASLLLKNGSRFFSEFPEASLGAVISALLPAPAVTAKILGKLFENFFSDPDVDWIDGYSDGTLSDPQAQLIDDTFGWFFGTAQATIGNFANSIDSITASNTFADLAFATANLDLSNITANDLSFTGGGFTYVDSVGLARIEVGQNAATGGFQVFYYDDTGSPIINLSEDPAGQTTTLTHAGDPNGSPFDYFIDTGTGELTGFEQKEAGGEVILHGYVSTIQNPDGTTTVVTTREGTEANNNIRWSTQVITADQQGLIDRHQGAANIGALFGSTLGSVIGGDNVFARVAASTVLSTVLSHVASNIFQSANAAEIAQQGVDQALDQQLPGLASTFRSQAIGAVSSFLTGELSEALDIGDNFGGALFSYAGNKAIGSVLTNVANGLDPFTGFSGQLFSSPSFQASFGAFVGGYLGNQVVAPQTQAGAIAGSLGGTLGAAIGAGLAGLTAVTGGFLGSIGSTILTTLGISAIFTAGANVLANFLLPGIGAFIGTILGNIIGDFLSDIFGWNDGPDSFWGNQPVTYDYETGVYKRGQITYDQDINGTDINNLQEMADSAINVLNSYMDTVGGTVVSARAPGFYMAWTASQQYFRIQANTAEGTYENADGSGLVQKAILATLKNVKIKGGDPYLKRILANSQATSLEQLNGEMQMAADYAAYVKNKAVIDAIISQDSQSAFAAAWVITLIRASELGITDWSETDFFGGFAQFFADFNLEAQGFSLADLSISIDGTTLVFEQLDEAGVSIAKIEIADFVTKIEYSHIVATIDGVQVNGTAGSDIWIAEDVNSIFVDAGTATEGLSNDILIGGAGDDQITAGEGDDYVRGGAGNDTIDGGSGDDTLYGEAGNDTLIGGAGDDLLDGGDGDDVLQGDAGDDILRGGAGDDTLTGGAGDDLLITGLGTDTLDGGDGVDAVSFEDAVAGVSVDLGSNGSGEITAVGSEFLVNSTTGDHQREPEIAALDDGGFVVVWESDGNQDGSAYGIFGQRYDAQGQAVGVEFQVNSYTSGAQWNADVAALNGGGFVVVWDSPGQDGSNDGVYGQRFDAQGVVTGSEFLVNSHTSDHQREPAAVALSDGGFVVVWQSDDHQDGNSYGVFGQRYDALGAIVGTEFQVNSTTDNGQLEPVITALSDGGFIVIWQSRNQDGSDDWGIFGQRFDVNSVAVGGEFQINTQTYQEQSYAAVTALSDSGFAVVWQSYDQDGSLYGIYGQRYDSAGIAAGSEFQVNTETAHKQEAPSIVALPDGGFVVVWQSDNQDGSSYGVYGQRYDSDGVSVGPEFLINSTTGNHQRAPAITVRSDGSLAIVWQSFGQDGSNEGIYGQLFDAPIVPTNTITNIENIIGSTFDDTLIGDANANVIDGGTGSDIIDGGAGIDTVSYQSADIGHQIDMEAGTAVAPIPVEAGDTPVDTDTLLNIENVIGSNFTDIIHGAINGGRIDGAGGNDIITIRSDDTAVAAGAAAYEIIGGEGFDTLGFKDWVETRGVFVDLSGAASANSYTSIEMVSGTTLDDQFIGTGADEVFSGDDGSDTIEGGAGDDIAVFEGSIHDYVLTQSAGAIQVARVDAPAVIDTLTGIESLRFVDELVLQRLGIGASDSVDFNGVSDFQYGVATDDTLTAAAGGSWLSSGAGNDTLNGAAGSDVLIGGAGNDLLNGGAGDDQSIYWLGDGHDIINDIDGKDTLVLGGGISLDEIVLRVGNLSNQSDQSSFVEAMQDELFYDLKIEILDPDTGAVSGSVTLVDFQDLTNLEDGVRILGDIELTIPELLDQKGISYRERIRGTANADTITGGIADEELDGFAGNDTLDGGSGSDHLLGGLGNDTLIGGRGADILDGGDGVDTADYINASEGVALDLGAGTGTGGEAQGDTLSNIENVIGSSFGDTLKGGSGGNTLQGGAGDDTYVFATGDGLDTIIDHAIETHQEQQAYTVTDGYYVPLTDGEGNPIFVQIGTDGEGNAIYSNEQAQQWIDMSYTAYETIDVDVHVEGGSDTLLFGSGITASDLTARFEGSDLVVGFTDPADPGTAFDLLTDRIRLTNWTDPLDRVENFAFADGSTLDVAGIVGLLGTLANDTITWTETALVVDGGAGDDVITGGTFGDTLDGGAGADILHGGAGNDFLSGGAGDDILNGGAGDDVARYTANIADYAIEKNSDGSLSIRDLSGAEGIDTLSDIETLEFADGSLVIDPSNANPVALESVIALAEAQTVAGLLSGSDAEDAAAALTYALEGAGPANGSVTVNADGSYSYTPTAGFTGTDSFTYRVTDSGGLSKTASVGISVEVEVSDPVVWDSTVGSASFSNDGQTITTTGGHQRARSTLSANGKIYAELTQSGVGIGFGVASAASPLTNYVGGEAESWGLYDNNEYLFLRHSGGGPSLGGSITSGDVLQVAYDAVTGELWLGKNNVWYDSAGGTTGDPDNGSNATYTGLPSDLYLVGSVWGGDTATLVADDALWTYAAPGGFAELAPLAGDLLLTSADGNDILSGGAGADTLNGGDGDDTLNGGAGNDTLRGGAGDDVLDGGAGRDVLDGGAGFDIASYASSDVGVEIDLATTGEIQAVGGEFQVNSTTASYQSVPAISALSDGGFVAVWFSYLQDGDHYGVYAQRFDAQGVAAGPEIQANSYTAGGQQEPDVAALNDGSFVVVWESDDQDGSTKGIFGQRFSALGAAVGGEFQVNTYTSNHQENTKIVALSDGGFVIVWQSDGQDGTGYGVYGQRYDAQGASVGSEFRANTYTITSQLYADITVLTDGGFVVVWGSNDQLGQVNGWDVFGQRYDAQGASVGAEFQVNTYITSAQLHADITALNDGGFVVVWESYGQDGSVYGVYGQRYDTLGVAVGAEFQINTQTSNNQQMAAVVALSDGGFAVVWGSESQDGSGFGIYGQRYDVQGAAVGSEFLINSTTIDHQQLPAITELDDGRLAVVWQSNLQDGSNEGIYGQLFDVPALLQNQFIDIEAIEGSAFGDTLTGNSSDNIFYGLAGDDTLSGGAGNDTIDGGAGADVMKGGEGDDSYVVDNVGDVIVESALPGFTAPSGWTILGTTDFDNDGDTDVLVSGASTNEIWLLHDGSVVSTVTDLPTSSTSGWTGWVLQGLLDYDGDGDKDLLYYRGGYDPYALTMDGVTQAGGGSYVASATPDLVDDFIPTNSGTDTVEASISYTLGNYVENLTLTGTADLDGIGNALANTLTGNAGNNILDGGAGADTLIGGAGDDNYIVEDAGDTVVEAADEGIDTVTASATQTLGANVENLILTGLSDIDGTGNALANTLTGNAGDNTLIGGAGADVAVYVGNRSDYGIEYDVSSGSFTVLDFDAVLDGDEGIDTVIDVETLRFADGDFDISAVAEGPTASDSVLLTPEGTVGTWQLTGASNTGAASYRIDPSEGDADADGWVTLDSGARVRITDAATGAYEYDPGVFAGEDAFAFRVTDVNGISSTASVSVGVGSVAGYNIGNAVQFTGGDNQYLSFTPAQEGNRTTWTFSTWVKREQLNEMGVIFGRYKDASTGALLRFDPAGRLELFHEVLGVQRNVLSSQTFTEADGWLHIVASVDTTQAVENQRVRLFVNGAQITDFFSEAYHAQGTAFQVNNTAAHAIGRNDAGAQYFKGQLADLHFVDGQALEAGSFGELDSGGVWKARPADVVDHGTNGFHMNFSDAGGLGADSSGNANNWTVNGSAQQSLDPVGHLTSDPLSNIISTAGNDSLEGGNEANTFNGLGGDDRLIGNAGDDTLDGGLGNDLLSGGAGNDTLTGGAGDDTLDGGAGRDVLDGGAGNDTASFESAEAGVTADLGNTVGSVSPVGNEFRVNTETSGSQKDSKMAALSDGGFVVVWQSDDQDGSGRGIFAQRYDALGATVGAEFIVNSTTSGGQENAEVTALDDGGFVAFWRSDGQDGSGQGIYGQRFDAEGLDVGGEFLVNSYTPDNQASPRATTLTDGGFVVVWMSFGQDGSSNGVYGQRYDAQGATVGAEFRANSTTSSYQGVPTIVALDDGGFVVAWRSDGQDGSGWGAYAQRYNVQGVAVGGEFLINTEIAADQEEPTLAALSDGGFVAIWRSLAQDGSGFGVYGQRYNAQGVAVGGEFLVNTTTAGHQFVLDVVMLPEGGFVVAWSSDGQDGSGTGVYGQRYDTQGLSVGNEFRINTTTANNEQSPSIVALSNGHLMAVWVSEGLSGGNGQDGSGTGVYGQLLDVPPLPEDTFINVENILGSAFGDVLTGKAGNNIFNGLAGNDTLSGGAGNDTLIGGAGDDTYLFATGDGQDVINNGDADPLSTDQLVFGGSITSDDLWFARNGDDLTVSVLGTQDNVTIANWYADTASTLDEFAASDSMTLGASEIDQLVSAMAAFTPSDGTASSGVEPGALPTDVQLTIDSTWQSAA